MVEYDIKAVIIFPCFNEEDRINKVMLLEFIQNNLYSYIFVNDGSTDGTLEILNELKKESSRINVIDLDQNTGKANAIQQGMMFAIKQLDSELYGFWDVDLSTPLPEIEHLLEEYSRTKAMILTGCRVKRLGAKIERSGVRHFLGRSFATIVSILFDISTYDTQCGAKLFHNSIVDNLFRDGFESNWIFDVGLFLRMKAIHPADINELCIEVPLYEWQEIKGSKLKFSDFLKVPIELYRLVRKYLWI